MVTWAHYSRPNFYSAAVYLWQSNFSIMVLANFALLAFYLIVRTFQRLFFGTLRALEVETLWERGWIVGTEWLLSMSTFRGDMGLETAILFMLLLVGKAWAWICEGRVDSLDHQIQQNPHVGRFAWLRNHGRLMGAVALEVYFALQALYYCTEEVMLQPKPGVMVMFAFEWAILFMSTTQIALKFAAWGWEQIVLERQRKARLEELAIQQGGEPVAEEDFDVNDLDLPGWEGRTKFLFLLDVTIGVYAYYLKILC
jgi:E3 ubiquitin-protein ligase synoviolin